MTSRCHVIRRKPQWSFTASKSLCLILLAFALVNPGAVSGASTLLEIVSPDPQYFSEFGHSISGVSDVTGDGRGDLIVGAHLEEVGSIQQVGRVYIFNGATGSLFRTLQAPNQQLGAHFGYSVAGSADLNGDSFGDVIVGAPGEEEPESSLYGKVYVFSGATGSLLLSLFPPPSGGFAADYEYGFSVACIADVNGNGKPDVMISGPRLDGGLPGQNNSGKVFIQDGGTGALLRAVVSPNAESYGRFGYSISSLDDLSGDGVEDFIVGAMGETVSSNGGAGRTYLFSGANGGLLLQLNSPNPEYMGAFGWDVSRVPGVSGLGQPAGFAVGAPAEDGAFVGDSGKVHVYSGITLTRIRTLVSPNPQGVYPPETFFSKSFGWALEGVGDQDNDGVGDLLIASPAEILNGPTPGVPYMRGRVYLFSGYIGTVLETFEPPNQHNDYYESFANDVTSLPHTLSGWRRAGMAIGAVNAVVEPSPNQIAGKAYLIIPPNSVEEWAVYD